MDKKEAILERNKISRLLGTEAQDDNLERNIFLLQSLDRQKDVIDIIGKVYVLIKEGQESHAFKDIKDEMCELIEALGKYQEAFSKEFKVIVSNFPPALKEVKISNAEDFKQDHPKSIRVSNLNEIKPEKPPAEISVKKPAWYKEFDFGKLLKFSKDSSEGLFKQVKTTIFKSFIKNVKPKEAIPVRLVTEDGEKFYRAGNVYVGGRSGCVIVDALPAGTNLIGQVYGHDNTSVIYSGIIPRTPQFAAIDCATSGDNTIVAAGTNKIRVLSCFLIAKGAVDVRFESGAGGAALSGQVSLIANTGFVLPYNPLGWFETETATLLNLELSAAVSVDGALTYIDTT